MANQLIPENQFQTAVPSSDGLLTLRSINTDSKSNSDLQSEVEELGGHQ